MNSGEKALSSPLHQLLVAAALLLSAIFLAFGEALSCYFTCDDLWHLPRLARGFSGEIELLFDSFWKPWTDRTTAYLFFRPVTELTLVFDFLLYKGGAAGYHLSNLLYHWLNATLVFFLSRLLFSTFSDRTKKGESWWNFIAPLLVALLFAVHPLNTEPVVWILCRADLVGALFFLLSTITFLVGQKQSKSRVSILSYLFLACGLLSKESCATIPLVLTILTFTVAYLKEGKSDLESLIISSLKQVRFHWLILLGYLVLRAFVLNSVSGGYVGSIGYILNETWMERLFIPLSFWKAIHPFNTEVFQPDNAVEISLRILYVLIALLLILNKKFSASIEKRSGYFLTVTVFLCLIFSINTPVWSITDGMAGSRIAYFMTIPVVLGLVLILIPDPDQEKNSKKDNQLFLAGCFSLALLVCVYVLIARVNTNAWVKASEETRQIKKAIEKECASLPEQGQKLLLFNLPSHIKGTIAFFSSDYLKGLLQPPLTRVDLSNKVVDLDGCPIQSPLLNRDLIRLLTEEGNPAPRYWSKEDKKLIPVRQNWIGQEPSVPRTLAIESIGNFGRLKGEEKVFDNNNPGDKVTSFKLRGADPDSTNSTADGMLLCLKIEADEKVDTTRAGALSWKSKEKLHPLFFQLVKESGVHTYKIPLSLYKDWIRARPGHLELRLDLPPRHFFLKSASLKPLGTEQPVLLVEKPEILDFDTNGMLRVKNLKLNLFYDLEHLKNSRGLRLEVSKPNCQFAIYNHSLLDLEKLAEKHLLKSFEIKTDSLKGFHKLDLGFTNEVINGRSAYFQVRAAALDADGFICGAYSSPLDIEVEKN